MEQLSKGGTTPASRRLEYLLGFGILLTIAVVGLAMVKWVPYWGRSFDVAAGLSLGASIISGAAAAPPPPSLTAAFDYTLVYMQKIWSAMVLGLLLAATVEALVPRDWLLRVLGSGAARSSALGGLLALPGMM